ncbi:EamA family transporter [Alkalicaulis satelles]|uniref:EamA family transporter n=1 Tax=Alkalicaulis satelles TaxID=2609175 RepID=A0A5M6ZJJ1_9PROT|nr:EamA family transporter [Alkalicaulis satelles]KAA5803914.1 EamA family transporter [Alkalicaulis satelles]
MAARPDQASLTGVMALLTAACVIGFAAPLVKLSELGPQAIAFWRLALAVPALGLWLIFEERRNRARPAPINPAPAGRQWRLLALAGVFFAGDLAFWHAGIKITTAANATLLANLTPVIVAIAAWLLFKERISTRFVIAAILALGGAVLLSAANVRFAPERLTGDILSALTALWYAAYILTVRAARMTGAGTARVMFWSTLAAAPISLAITLIAGERVFPQTLEGWAPLLALGVIVHALGQGGIAFGLGRTPASIASLVILVQPVVAAAAGWILFGETLVMVQWFGAGLVLSGVYLAQRTGPRAGPGPRPRG